jgi:hypothetical protein
MSIKAYLGEQILGVLACYHGDAVEVHICGVYPKWDNWLRVFFPKGHKLKEGELATIHLDNRSGVYEIDEALRVYRMSYKGRVSEVDEDWVLLEPLECMMYHSFHVVEDIRAPGYRYPEDDRPELAIPPTALQSFPPASQHDRLNKTGVLVTIAKRQPHTTVMAFLSTDEEDIFFITVPDSFKGKLLRRDRRCLFVIDERASFTFERHIEWNYTILEGEAYLVPKDTALFEEVRQAFIEKNPFELGFFAREDLEMFHMRGKRILFSGEPSKLTY